MIAIVAAENSRGDRIQGGSQVSEMRHFRVTFVAAALRNYFAAGGHGLRSHRAWLSNHPLFLKSRRKEVAICRRSFRSGPGGIEREDRSICRRN
jgi:hypothetical protein